MRFYLSKADEAGHESDRQRVMMQIVQELCKRPGMFHIKYPSWGIFTKIFLKITNRNLFFFSTRYFLCLLFFRSQQNRVRYADNLHTKSEQGVK